MPYSFVIITQKKKKQIVYTYFYEIVFIHILTKF